MAWLIPAVLLVASPLPPARPQRELHVAVLALAADPTAASSNGRLAKAISIRLEAEGLRVTQLGVLRPLPAEEATAEAAVSGADFVIAVEGTSACSVLLVPPKVSEPVQAAGPVDHAELLALIKQTTEASRYRLSATAAVALKGSTSWCERAPDELEAYVLSAAHAPVVLLRLTDASLDAVARDLPQALRLAVKGEHP